MWKENNMKEKHLNAISSRCHQNTKHFIIFLLCCVLIVAHFICFICFQWGLLTGNDVWVDYLLFVYIIFKATRVEITQLKGNRSWLIRNLAFPLSLSFSEYSQCIFKSIDRKKGKKSIGNCLFLCHFDAHGNILLSCLHFFKRHKQFWNKE